MREALRRFRSLRRLARWYRGKTVAYPRWSSLLGQTWPAVRREVESADGPRILLATSLGGYWAGTTVESTLGLALALRGAQIDVLLCDGVLDACQRCEVRAYADPTQFADCGPQADLCADCFTPGAKFYEECGFRVHRYSDFLTDEDHAKCDAIVAETPYEEIRPYVRNDLAIGEQALAGALRFFARGDLRSEPAGEAVLKRYFRAALLTQIVSEKLFDAEEYEAAVFHHGIYVPQGVIGAVARQRGPRVVNWTPAYRKQCFVFSHDDTYHHTLLTEPTDDWASMPFGDSERSALERYLASRRAGTQDWIWFHDRPEEDADGIARECQLPSDKPVVGLLTNVVWDAQLHYPANAFESMTEWVIDTIRWFEEHPELHLVIRVHPAEIRGTLPSRQRMTDEIRARFSRLPENVSVVPPESQVSTYGLLDRCCAGLIYGTKTGVELAASGKPVVVAGEAWVRGKGFTLDAASRDEYFDHLARLPLKPMTGGQLERAQRYAYHVFFRRMIPLEFMQGTGGDPPYRPEVSVRDDLSPGASAGLDVICEGILRGTPFTYRAETLGWVPA